MKVDTEREEYIRIDGFDCRDENRRGEHGMERLGAERLSIIRALDNRNERVDA